MTRTTRQDARRSGKEDAGQSLFWKNASSDFTGNTIVNLERGLVGTWREGVFSDVTSDSGLKLSTNFPCLPRETGKGRALETDPSALEIDSSAQEKLSNEYM